jgi:hypothetical protein
MPHCPVCKCELDDTVSACPYCGSDVVDDDEELEEGAGGGDSLDEEEEEGHGAGDIDLDSAILLCKTYSRLHTEFLVESLKSAQIPYYCRIIGGLYGRGMPGVVGIFGSRAADAEIFVPPDYHEEADEIRRQAIGDE